MEKTMKLVSMTPLKKREYPDKKTGENREIAWVELEMTDGIDSLIAELVVPPVYENGNKTYRQPELMCEYLYRIQAEISCNTGSKDGREWYSNRVNIKKMTRV